MTAVGAVAQSLSDEDRELAIQRAGAAMQKHYAEWESFRKTVRESLDYDQQTGIFRWKKAIGKRAKVGTVAGGLLVDGYVGIYIARKRYGAHRLAWLYVHGQWPQEQIDHINRDRADNRIANLRVLTQMQNAQNTISNRSKHGLPGINQRGALWQAQITLERKRISLGFFRTKEQASTAYLEAKERLHPYYSPQPSLGSAHHARILMEKLIAGRSPAQVAKMEQERGLC